MLRRHTDAIILNGNFAEAILYLGCYKNIVSDITLWRTAVKNCVFNQRLKNQFWYFRLINCIVFFNIKVQSVLITQIQDMQK